uniref:Phosphorylase b kinase regulatory subunit n=1 Tax=Ascaris lumbricoides TaxID=6252 RepID=A0A0M3HFC4_ASCLU
LRDVQLSSGFKEQFSNSSAALVRSQRRTRTHVPVDACVRTPGETHAIFSHYQRCPNSGMGNSRRNSTRFDSLEMHNEYSHKKQYVLIALAQIWGALLISSETKFAVNKVCSQAVEVGTARGLSGVLSLPPSKRFHLAMKPRQDVLQLTAPRNR